MDAVVPRDPSVKRTFLKTACGVDDEDLLEAIWELQVRWDDGRLGAAECWEDADREEASGLGASQTLAIAEGTECRRLTIGGLVVGGIQRPD